MFSGDLFQYETVVHLWTAGVWDAYALKVSGSQDVLGPFVNQLSLDLEC